MNLKLPFGARRTPGGRLLAREQPASVFIPYTCHLDPNTIGFDDGRMMQVIAIEGFRFETESDAVLARNIGAINTLLKAQQRGYTLHTTLIRRKETVELSKPFPPGYAALLNRDWMKQFQNRELFVNELFLAVVSEPQADSSTWWLPKRIRTVTMEAREQMLRELHQVTQSFMELMRDYGTRRLGTVKRVLGSGEEVDCSEILEYLSRIFNHDHRPFPLPDQMISESLGTQTRLYFPHRTIIREGHTDLSTDYSAIFSLVRYPSRTYSGLFNSLLQLPFELIVSQSFLPIPPEQALVDLRILRNRSEAAGEPRSVLKSIDEAINQLGIGDVAFGHHHLTIECRGSSRAELERRVSKLSHLFTEVGASVRREDLGTDLAFWAQLPGNAEDFIARGKPVSTRNLAAFSSFHNYGRGSPTGNFLGEALTVVTTAGDTPYYLNLHNADGLGNTCVFGKSGSGKTVLCAFLIAQSQKYGGRTIVLDNDNSWEIYVRAENGTYITMSPGTSTGINYLQLPDTHANRRFMAHMTEHLLEHGLQRALTFDEKTRVERAVRTVCDHPQPERRMEILRQALYTEDLRGAIAPWVEGGAHGWILDAPEDTVSFRDRVTGIDIGWVLSDKDARAPVMRYLLHRMEEAINATGITRIVLEEGWRLIKDPTLGAACEDWARTVRKKGAFTIFASQSVNLESEAGQALYDQSATRVFFPDAEADELSYEKLGLTKAQINFLRTTHPHERRVFIKHGDQATIIKVHIPMPWHLAVLGGNKESVARMRALREQYGHRPQQWLQHFMKEYAHAHGTS